MSTTLARVALIAATSALGLSRLHRRLQLSKAKHPSLRGHSRIARRLAQQVPFYAYEGERFFNSDGAPDAVADQRRAALTRLGERYRERCPKTLRLSRELEDSVSDLQFTSRYRVPFQYRELVHSALPSGAFVESSQGVRVTDPDGNAWIDLSGSYGVNLFGYDFYKSCLNDAHAAMGKLGPVLGHYHPVVVDNVRRLTQLSGLDEVSFHMSGTEAVMQAVRLARYHTGRTHLVRFCGAYHGWWGDVQPGGGNPTPALHTYTLKDMSEDTLKVLRTRSDIACVLVNPLQALHPNDSAPSDSMLLAGGRKASFDKAKYSAWLKQLRAVCRERGIVLIMDEVFMGFRLGPRGAQAYFDVQADMVTYGKTLGGGLPVGVLCGRADLMKRYRDDRPTDICFARGTFNAHPYVMASMDAFLRRLETGATAALYEGLETKWDERARTLNQRLAAEALPVRIESLSTVWMVCYPLASRYNWMFQYYLREEGLLLSWIGTGRLIFSLNFSDSDFEQVCDKFVAAARAMKADGWWWTADDASAKGIGRTVLRELLHHRLRGGAGRELPQALPAGAAQGRLFSGESSAHST